MFWDDASAREKEKKRDKKKKIASRPNPSFLKTRKLPSIQHHTHHTRRLFPNYQPGVLTKRNVDPIAAESRLPLTPSPTLMTYEPRVWAMSSHTTTESDKQSNNQGLITIVGFKCPKNPIWKHTHTWCFYIKADFETEMTICVCNPLIWCDGSHARHGRSCLRYSGTTSRSDQSGCQDSTGSQVLARNPLGKL